MTNCDPYLRTTREYTVILTVTDNAGVTTNYSQVVRISDTSEASTGFGAGFLKPNEILILLAAIGVTALVLYGIYDTAPVMSSYRNA